MYFRQADPTDTPVQAKNHTWVDAYRRDLVEMYKEIREAWYGISRDYIGVIRSLGILHLHQPE